jgi:hypothetical protein
MRGSSPRNESRKSGDPPGSPGCAASIRSGFGCETKRTVEADRDDLRPRRRCRRKRRKRRSWRRSKATAPRPRGRRSAKSHDRPRASKNASIAEPRAPEEKSSSARKSVVSSIRRPHANQGAHGITSPRQDNIVANPTSEPLKNKRPVLHLDDMTLIITRFFETMRIAYQRPRNTAARRSTNDWTPSLASSLVMTRSQTFGM